MDAAKPSACPLTCGLKVRRFTSVATTPPGTSFCPGVQNPGRTFLHWPKPSLCRRIFSPIAKIRRRKSVVCSSVLGGNSDKVSHVVTSIQNCHFERSGVIRECGWACGVEKSAFLLALAKHKVPRLRSE